MARQLGTKALIVSDAIMDGLGYVSQCQSILQKENISAVVYLGVKTEPTDQYVEEALRLLEENGCDLIISIGGGSCIDTAKAVSVLAANPGHISDYADPAKNPDEPPGSPHRDSDDGGYGLRGDGCHGHHDHQNGCEADGQAAGVPARRRHRGSRTDDVLAEKA